MARAIRQPLAEGAKPVGPVYGDTWDDIVREARRVTSIPFGQVELDQNFGGGMHKTFHGKDDKERRGDYNAYVIVTPAPKVVPEPVKGVEYYSLDELRRALTDLNYTGTDGIIEKVRQKVSVRNDGRYALDELKKAYKQIDRILGGDYADRKLDAAALQARKNRVFDAHGGS